MSDGERPRAKSKGHLVVKRGPGQSIVIGDDIEVIVLAVASKTVRLGVIAPREVRVLRAEAYRKTLRTRR